MTEQDEDFLKRWSRRKQAAAEHAARAKEPPAPDSPPEEEPSKSGDAFDPATLPPIDSITAISDIREFLHANVPSELTRAALRRAWSTDPAIRDFIGLSENAWDFTAPDSIPGFGPLDASREEIKALVDQIIGHAADLAEGGGPGQHGETLQATVQSDPQPGAREPSEPPSVAAEAATEALPPPDTESRAVDVAMQQARSDDSGDRPRPRRSRGAALPR